MSRDMIVTGPTLGSPRWAGDFLGGDSLVPGPNKLDAAQFGATDAVTVTLTANAAAGATSLTVTALTGIIPAGTQLDFGGAKLAITSADAAAGATTVAVRATPTAMVSTDDAVYPGTETKYVRSGTVLGRTIAERDAATGYGPAIDTDDEIFLLAFDVDDADENADCELYRHNKQVFENYLPVLPAAMDADLLAILRDVYIMTVGHE